MKRYWVSKCEDGTWDVVRRANRYNGNTVSNHRTRQEARDEADKRNNHGEMWAASFEAGKRAFLDYQDE